MPLPLPRALSMGLFNCSGLYPALAAMEHLSSARAHLPFGFFFGRPAAYAAPRPIQRRSAAGSLEALGGMTTYSFIGRPGMGSNAAQPSFSAFARSSSGRRMTTFGPNVPANMFPPRKNAG